MATFQSVFEINGKANADLSAKQFYAAKLAGQDLVDVAGATDRAIGILQNKPLAGQAADVQVLGLSKAVSDGSGTPIAAGDVVGPNGSGALVKKATADYNACGIALDPSTAAGTVIRVLLIPGLVFRSLAG